jgi:hypothetical protein
MGRNFNPIHPSILHPDSVSAFYFTSGLGEPSCKAAPADGITIRSPKGMRAQFTANGVNIDIGSTVILRAGANKEMSVHLVEGSARITSDNKTVALRPGQTSRIPLGGIDGLQPIGTPSAPVNESEGLADQTFIGIVVSTVAPTQAPTMQPAQPTPTTVFASRTPTLAPTRPTKPTYTPKAPKPTYTPKAPKPTYTPKAPKPTYTPKP